MQENKGIYDNVYELGYHLLPTIEEGALDKSVQNIKDAIAQNGGTVVGEEAPKLISLAYPISKDGIEGDFDKAYFGWLKFEIAGDNLLALSDFAKGSKDIIRFLIVETDKENNIHYHKATAPSKQEESLVNKATETEIDKSIEELVIA